MSRALASEEPAGGNEPSRIRYLNTDLDLVSEQDLRPLTEAFKASGLSPLHVAAADDGRWFATLETDQQFSEPEQTVAVMLTVIEQLVPALRHCWDRCELREFNIGYDCGNEPWAFNQGLSNSLLGRIAAAGATLRITIYPQREHAEISAGELPPEL